MKIKLISILFCAGVVLTLGYCGKIERKIADYTGHSTICIDDVEYIQFTSGASVKYKPDGKISTCE